MVRGFTGALQFGVVKADEFFDPPNVGIGGAGGVVFEFDDVAVLVNQFLALHFFGLHCEEGVSILELGWVMFLDLLWG